MKKIGTKITLSSVLLCTIIILCFGALTIVESQKTIEKESNDKILYLSQSSSNNFNIEASKIEDSVSSLSIVTASQFDISKANDADYLQNFSSTMAPIVKQFGENTDGVISTYVYTNFQVTNNQLYGAWYADKSSNGGSRSFT